MTSQGITCIAGGLLTAARAGLTVVEHAAGRTMTTPPPDRAWRVETATPGWFVFRCQPAGQVLTVSGRDDDLQVVLAATATGYPPPLADHPLSRARKHGHHQPGDRTRPHSGHTRAGRPPPVGLTAYHGAATQHWSFTDHQGGTHAIWPNRDSLRWMRKNEPALPQGRPAEHESSQNTLCAHLPEGHYN